MATIIKDRPTVEGVAAAERALELLTCFRTGDKALSLAEIADRTGLVKSTIMRLAVSLERYNLIVRLHDGRYQLGSGVVRLSTIYQDSVALEEHIMPVLASLAVMTQETATFYVRHGDVRLCLFRVNSPSSLRLDVQPGTQRPMDDAGSAQLLRLFADWPDERPALPPLPIYTVGATTPHVASASVPVIGQGNRLVGALSLAGPDAEAFASIPRYDYHQLHSGCRCRSRVSIGCDVQKLAVSEKTTVLPAMLPPPFMPLLNAGSRYAVRR